MVLIEGRAGMGGGIQLPLLSCLLLLLLALVGVGFCDDSSMQTKCQSEFTKLGICLDYATAKSTAPSPSCCSSVSDIRSKDAACLCYIIQQAHTGSPSTKSIGLQFDRLLQLPGACKLANADISDCPKLLNIPPSSPDYGIFNNATAKAASTSPASASTTSTSKGVMHQICLDGGTFIVAASAIVLSIYL